MEYTFLNRFMYIGDLTCALLRYGFVTDARDRKESTKYSIGDGPYQLFHSIFHVDSAGSSETLNFALSFQVMKEPDTFLVPYKMNYLVVLTPTEAEVVDAD